MAEPFAAEAAEAPAECPCCVRHAAAFDAGIRALEEIRADLDRMTEDLRRRNEAIVSLRPIARV